MTEPIHKYPRTLHLEGSRMQPGDEDLEAVPFSDVAGRHLVVEEKMDGANCAVSFSTGGELLLQSRGHFLTGGPRERHFAMFKQWAATLTVPLRDRLGARYVMYGEWLYAKHTIFYDGLPHYFLEFDILDEQTGEFLDTPRRRNLLAGLPITSAVVLGEGPFRRLQDLTALVGKSHFIAEHHIEHLRSHAVQLGLDPDRVISETDTTSLMEGLYIKTEEDGVVSGRHKYVRADFLTRVLHAEGHWLTRPIVPNKLCAGVDIFRTGPT
jgi:hypothetical protein